MKKSLVQGLCLAALSFSAVQARAEDPAPAPREQTAVDSALKRDTTPIAFNAPTSSAPENVVPGRASGGPIEGKPSGFAVKGTTKAQSNLGAGSPTTTAGPQLASAPLKPAARPQRGRRNEAKADDPQRPVLEAMNPSFAACLTAADANVDGAAMLNVSISESGDVAAVTTVTPGGVSPKASACFRDVLAHAKFAPAAAASVVRVRLAPRELRAPAPAAVAQN